METLIAQSPECALVTFLTYFAVTSPRFVFGTGTPTAVRVALL